MTFTSLFSSVTGSVVMFLAMRHPLGVDVGDLLRQLGLEVFQLLVQQLDLVLGGVEPFARRSGAATLAGGAAGLLEHRAQHAAARLAAAEQVAEDRAGGGEQLVVAAALLLGLQHLGAILGRLQLRLQRGDLRLVLVAQLGGVRVALGVGRLVAALVERVGGLAGRL